MILVIGEILFDLFLDDRRIGGAPFNFAFHLKKLGFDVRFISRVGQDDLGSNAIEAVEAARFDPGDIQRDTLFPTGRVKVVMDVDGSHEFCIAQNTAYDHIVFDHRLKALSESGPALFYFGTLIQRTPHGHSLVKSVLDHLPPETQTFCDINLRPGCYSKKTIAFSIRASDILKLSLEELCLLVPDQGMGLEQRAARLLEKGPKCVILTLGEKGSLWVSKKGGAFPFSRLYRWHWIVHVCHLLQAVPTPCFIK
ncbi:MAG: hypothetical protein HUK40_16415 [Desulfobacter sp.]|nr:hypothetical protein [Desulfobacter sp.]